MPNIRPSSDLRNSYNEISEYCHENDETIYITKNGKGDLAVMSIEKYEQLTGKFELYRSIDIGIDDIKAGRVKTAEEFFEELDKDNG